MKLVKIILILFFLFTLFSCSIGKEMRYESTLTGLGWDTLIGYEFGKVVALYRFIDHQTGVVVYCSSDGCITSSPIKVKE